MKKSFFLFGILLLLVVVMFPSPPQFAHAQTSREIDSQIKQRQKQLDELNRRIKVLQSSIEVKRAQRLTLENQISILEDQIATSQIEVQKSQIVIATLTERINETELAISALDNERIEKREQLSQLLKDIQIAQSQNLLTLFLATRNWSQVIALRQQRGSIAQQITETLAILRQNADAYSRLQQNLETERADQVIAKKELESKLAQIESQTEQKEAILTATRAEESQFQRLLLKARDQFAEANNEIQTLERKLRAKLEEERRAEQERLRKAQQAAREQAERERLAAEERRRAASLEEVGRGGLSWPVASRRITAFFNDPNYPFRRFFEHPAIDIGGVEQGTPVRAAAAGYVARARDAGMGYSFIMIIHGNGISTVYGHLSSIYARQDAYVAKGEIIGLSGGMPGTRGAGALTTGPHLHFEVRKDGIPVNPLDYLP